MGQGEQPHLRIAENQARFRAANERIEAIAVQTQFADDVPFLCECADERCVEIIRLSLADYEEARRHPRRFFNAMGHERLSVESGAAVVVASRSGYVLVDKVDGAGERAEERYEELSRRRSR